MREPISATLICSDKPEIRVPDPERNFGDRFPEMCKMKLINPDKIFTCKQNLLFAEKCTFCFTCLYLIVAKPSPSSEHVCLSRVTGPISVSLQCDS